MNIEDVLSFFMRANGDSEYAKYLALVLFVIILSPMALLFLFDFIFAIKNGWGFRQDKLFGKYVPNAGIQGEHLRNISINKDFLIITDEDFFDGVYRHKNIYNNSINDSKKQWLYNKEIDYNIILVAKCGDFSIKFTNLIDFCIYYNLPICRIIDSKPSDFKKYTEKLNDGTEIVYYMRCNDE